MVATSVHIHVHTKLWCDFAIANDTAAQRHNVHYKAELVGQVISVMQYAHMIQ